MQQEGIFVIIGEISEGVCVNKKHWGVLCDLFKNLHEAQLSDLR